MGILALNLQNEDDRDGTLRAIVQAALDLVAGADWAGISLIHVRHCRRLDPRLVAELDQLQSDLAKARA
jgi:hypothetical protein